MTLEGWPKIVRKVAIDSGRAWLLLFFLPFICCTNFALLNVVTAVMVEKVFEFAEDEKVNEAKRSHKDRKIAIQKICKLFACIDEDQNGSLSIQELKHAVTAESCTRQFQELGIAKHDIDSLFQCIDVDGNGELSTLEFIEGCLRMHGHATSKDLLRIQYDVHRTRSKLDFHLKRLTRLMTWSSICLQSDFEANHGTERRPRRRSTGVEPAQRRSRSASIDSSNSFSGKSFSATMPGTRGASLISRRASDFACDQSAQMTRRSSLLNRARRASIGTIMPCVEDLGGGGGALYSFDSVSAAPAANDGGEDQSTAVGGLKLRSRCEVRSKTAPATSRFGGHRRRSKHDLVASNRDRFSTDKFISNTSNASSSSVSADASSSNAPSLTSTASTAPTLAGLSGVSLGGGAAMVGSEHELPLPLEAHQLLAEVLEEQRRTRELLGVLGEEVRTLRSQVKHCEAAGGGSSATGPSGSGARGSDEKVVATLSSSSAVAAEMKAWPHGTPEGGSNPPTAAAVSSSSWRPGRKIAPALERGAGDAKVQLRRSMTGGCEIEGRTQPCAASNLFSIFKGVRQQMPSDEVSSSVLLKGLRRSKSANLR